MKQTFKKHTKETTIRVQNTQVSSVRKKEIVKKGLRLIEDGYIGVAGGLGDKNDDLLLEKAKEKLKIEIPYPFQLEPVKEKEVMINECTLNHENIMATVEDIMAFLREEYNEFDFSEVAKITENYISFKDDRGTDLSYQDTYLEFGFLMKEKALANLFDGFIGYSGRQYNHEKFLDSARMLLNAYGNKLEMPKEDELPVLIIDDSIFHRKLAEVLNGEKYGSGSSLLSKKIGEKVFHEKITILQDFDPLRTHRPFFDMEGVFNEDFTFPLVKDGVLKACYTDKKTAKTYDLMETGAASGDYDDVPTLNQTHLALKVDSKDLKGVVEKGILVVIAAGGDYTSDGAYATPVQKAFLFEEGEIKGVLPEFQLKSHLFNMLGKDYIGTFKSPFYFGDHDVITVANMKIKK